MGIPFQRHLSVREEGHPMAVQTGAIRCLQECKHQLLMSLFLWQTHTLGFNFRQNEIFRMH